jgi:hypothetical protein
MTVVPDPRADSIRVVTRFKVEFEWRRVGEVTLSEATGKLAFPRELAKIPGVYRFWIEPGPKRPEVYIGESRDLQRRAAQYRRGDASQKTSRWVHDRLFESLAGGATVVIEVMVHAHYAGLRSAPPWPARAREGRAGTDRDSTPRATRAQRPIVVARRP